jgi:FkbH-like protein
MQQKFANYHNIKFIDIDSAIKTFEKKMVDPRIKLIGRFPISQEFSKHLANIFAGYIAAVLAKSIRLIIVDLDNTLWGGIVGEDGILGIKIAGDYPGNCFSAFQRALKALSKRGIVLAIVSKNDESLVKQAFSQLDMPLKFSDFVTYRINWINKPDNIQSIASEIGLGLKNILFIDDSPIECAAVRNILPDVNVLQLPNDPAYYLEKLGSVNLLNYISIGKEDLKRHKSYIRRLKLISHRKKFCDLTDFYKSLNLTLHIDDLSTKNIARVSQLFTKTNQFNLTGVKYTIDELQELHNNGEKVLAIRVADKYSECETMGAIVITQRDNDWDIKNYVMSCRALGKNAEHEALKAILQYVRNTSMTKVYAKYVETDRNQLVRDFYKQLGFDPIDSDSKNQWVFDLTNDMVVSDWVTIVNEM